MAAVAIALGVATGGAVIAAQGNPNGNPDAPGNPNILAAINALRADLATAFNNVFQQLQNIQTALQGLIPAVNNVAITPAFNFGLSGQQHFVTCEAINRTNELRTVVVQLIEGGGTVVEDSGASNVVAGGVTSSTFPILGGSFYCRFTVTNGTTKDILASSTYIVNNVATAIATAQ